MTVRSVVRRSRALVSFCVRAGQLALRPGRAVGRALLPPVVGPWPAPDGRPLVFAAACASYFARFAEPFVRTVLETSPGARIHLHVFDPDAGMEATLRQWAEREPQRITFTSERLPPGLDPSPGAHTIYFQAARFVRIAELVDRGHRVLGLDIDCLVRADLVTAIAAAGDADIGLFLRPRHLDPGKRVLAACLLAAPTAGARAFLSRAADLIGRHLIEAGPTEKLDQLCLYWAYLRRDPALRVWHVPQALADWHMAPSSVVWMGKGSRKERLNLMPGAAQAARRSCGAAGGAVPPR
jgi:hypothetical protein